MKKALFISNHAGFSKFNAPYMQWFHDKGWQVDNASPGIETGYYDTQYDVPITRFPISFSNIKAFFELRRICKKNEYDLIHCHTPVGGVLGRLCSSKNSKTKVIYTAHGFHFCKGASILNWILFYPVEKMLAHRTDCIVTINEEDFDIASRKFKTKVRKIDGVGVNLERFRPIGKDEKKIIRVEYGFNTNDFIIVYCAQFIMRKNHRFLIDKLHILKKTIPNVKLCLIGSGRNEEEIKDYVKKNGLCDYVRFMGYRTDVERLYAISDVLVSPSVREGFPMNIVEGMSCGLPVVASDIRGHRDIINVAEENYIFNFTDDSFEKSIIILFKDDEFREKISNLNINYAKHFSIQHSLKMMSEIYKDVLEMVQ